jgi:GTP cyclohydrolase I
MNKQATLDKPDKEELELSIAKMLTALGYDIDTNGLRDTPSRVARFLVEQTARPKFKLSVFEEEGANEPVINGNLDWSSLCEHHMLPFFGTAIIGYLPNGKTIGGLSKFGRVIHHFAAGLNNQERITRAVGEFLFSHPELQPFGVGVILQAQHTCMNIRGVKCTRAQTVTQYLAGAFKTDAALRAEFLGTANRLLPKA